VLMYRTVCANVMNGSAQNFVSEKAYCLREL